MPDNRNGEQRRIAEAERQIREIKRRCDIVDYVAHYAGYELEPHGSGKYHLKVHDSLVLNSNEQTFRWYSRQLYGDVISLAQLDLATGAEIRTAGEARKMLYQQYVAAAERNPSNWQHEIKDTAPPAHQAEIEDDAASGDLTLPHCDNSKWKRLYAYLIQGRGISPEVVHWLVNQKLIYPDERGNLVYLDRTADGKPTYAAKKGSTSNNHFRWVDSRSNISARCTWNLGEKTRTVFITEAAVDAWSIMSLLHDAGADWQAYGYISLESCFGGPILYHLKKNPQIQKIYLAQDADEGGLKSRVQCRELLSEAGLNGLKIIDKIPADGKDWNEVLQAKRLAERAMVIDMENEQNAMKALRIEMDMAKLTARGIINTLRWVVNHQNNGIHYGEQTAKQLMRQGRETSVLDIPDKDIAALKTKCKDYGVDFAITAQHDQDGNVTKYSLMFKAMDIAVINEAIKGIVADKPKEKETAGKADVTEVCRDATEKAEHKNAEKMEHAVERGSQVR